jgi:hypothetical protein
VGATIVDPLTPTSARGGRRGDRLIFSAAAGLEITMLPGTASPPDAATRLDDVPRQTLAAMLDAGREVLEWRRILAKTGDNAVGLALRQQGPFHILDHYPKGDVFDPESHAQWYYHAHDKKDRPGEHGHFHTFMRGGGMPTGVKPAAPALTLPGVSENLTGDRA